MIVKRAEKTVDSTSLGHVTVTEVLTRCSRIIRHHVTRDRYNWMLRSWKSRRSRLLRWKFLFLNVSIDTRVEILLKRSNIMEKERKQRKKWTILESCAGRIAIFSTVSCTRRPATSTKMITFHREIVSRLVALRVNRIIGSVSRQIARGAQLPRLRGELSPFSSRSAGYFTRSTCLAVFNPIFRTQLFISL